MHISDKIAHILTTLYTSKGILPKSMHSWTDMYGYYTSVQYKPWEHAFFFAGWDGDSDENTYLTYDRQSRIDYKTAVREAWPLLSREDKTVIMATILGGSNGMA